MTPKRLFDRSAQPEQPTPRLQGDDLFVWAKLMSDLEHAQRALNDFGKGALRRNGYDLQQFALTNEGYIVSGSTSGPSSEPSPAE